MKIKKGLFLILIGFGFIQTGVAQERLSSIMSYPTQKGVRENIKSGAPSLELPFIEDFSSNFPYPNSEKWMDFYAFVNSSFGVNSIGTGVATLDALDSVGAIYEHATVDNFQADFLTSKPINLNIGGDTTLYLSFFYQPQGLGDAPEEQDSLILEFFAPDDNKWVWIWSTPGSAFHEFEQVMIPVRGAIFLKDGFQFRFRNMASLADAFLPSDKNNADHWNLDYIYLNKNRNYQDFNVNDLSLLRKTGSLLLNYSAIPWEHFRLAGINEVKTIFPVHLKNLSDSRKFYEPVFRIVDEYGSSQNFEKTLVADEIQAFQELKYDATFNYGFASDAIDSARFTIELDLNPTENDLIPENSKTTYTQEFSDYYAYDDGTAEAGYGLSGEGTSNGMVAIKYKNFHPGDSLVGVSIFFNRSFEDANRKFFSLAIWNEIDGQPGDLIHFQEGIRRQIENGLTGFDYFMLDTACVVTDSYYVGWKQVTEDFLNVGFDRNTNKQNTIFYKINQTWKNTSFEGSMMVRPVFANKSKKSGIVPNSSTPAWSDLRIYPNPVSHQLNIDFTNELSGARITILDLSGRQVMQPSLISHQLDLSSLPGGTYFIVIVKGQQKTSRKIIKLYE